VPRLFPGPDPMLAHIDPYAFWRLAHQERALRLRYYLVCLCAGHHEIVAWHFAMDPSPDATADVWDIVARWPDDRLERAIADAADLRRRGLPPRPVFEG